jgi:hypothetical protein
MEVAQGAGMQEKERELARITKMREEGKGERGRAYLYEKFLSLAAEYFVINEA